jgi:hypothetical protein
MLARCVGIAGETSSPAMQIMLPSNIKKREIEMSFFLTSTLEHGECYFMVSPVGHQGGMQYKKEDLG